MTRARLATILTAAALAAPAARADEPAQALIRPVAAYLAGEGKALMRAPVRVEPARGPRVGLPGARPDDVRRLLAERLQAAGVAVSDDAAAPTSVEVDFSTADRAGADLLRLRVRVVVTNREAGRQDRLTFKELVLEDRDELARLERVRGPVVELALPELARKLADAARLHKADGVWARPFQGPGNAGVGYARELRELLGRSGVEVTDAGRFAVQGSYSVEKLDGAARRLIFEAQLVEESTNRKLASARSEAVVSEDADNPVGAGELWVATGANRGLAPGRHEKPRPAAPARAAGDVVEAADGLPFGLALQVAKRPVPVEARGDKFIVRLAERDEYVVVLHNRSEHEAAVQLCIDGLGPWAFADAGPGRFGYIIVPAGKSAVVPGWLRSDARASAFTVARYHPSEKLAGPARSGEVGTITAVFHYCWAEDGKAPIDEEARGDDKPEPGAVTVPGADRDVTVRAVPRVIGKPRAAVSLRYALKAE